MFEGIINVAGDVDTSVSIRSETSKTPFELKSTHTEYTKLLEPNWVNERLIGIPGYCEHAVAEKSL